MKKKMVSVLLTASMLAGMTLWQKMQKHRKTKLPVTLPQMIPL